MTSRLFVNLIFITCVNIHVLGTLEIERCDDDLGICVSYDGYHAKRIRSAADYCDKTGHHLLEIKSQQMQNFLEYFFKEHILKHFERNKNFKSFLSLQRIDLETFRHTTGRNLCLNNRNFLKNDFGFNIELSGCDTDGFICFYKDDFNCEYCLKRHGVTLEIVREQLNWYQARQYCLNNNGDLWNMGNYKWKMKSFSVVESAYSRIKWIWSREESFTNYTNWKGGCENTSHGDNMNCAVITGDFTWKPSRCTLKDPIPVICMGSPLHYNESSETLCSVDVNTCLYHDYFRANNSESAKQHCNEANLNLLEIKSHGIQIFVQTYIERLTINSSEAKTNFMAFISLQRVDLDIFEPITKEYRHNLGGSANFMAISVNDDLKRISGCDKHYFYCYYPGRSERIKYYVIKQLNWYQAMQYCFNDNGYLWDGDSRHITLPYYRPRDFYGSAIAISKIRWRWSDENHFTTYTNWNGGCENTSHGDDMKCTVITGDFTWMPSRCILDAPLPVICVKNASKGDDSQSILLANKEKCDFSVGLCLRYYGYRTNFFHSAVNHCKMRYEKILEFGSNNAIHFIKGYLEDHMSKYYDDKVDIISFINVDLENFESNEDENTIAIFKNTSYEEASRCFVITGNFTLKPSSCYLYMSVPVICMGNLIQPRESSKLSHYFLEISLATFTIGLATLLSILAYFVVKKFRGQKIVLGVLSPANVNESSGDYTEIEDQYVNLPRINLTENAFPGLVDRLSHGDGSYTSLTFANNHDSRIYFSLRRENLDLEKNLEN